MVEYKPDSYHCAYMRDSKMKSRVSIFASGKLISVGAKSATDGFKDLKHVASILKRSKILKTEIENLQVRNVVVNVDLGVPLDITKIVESMPDVVYEPEQFPGVIMRTDEIEGAILLFASGKVVIAGLKSESMILKAATKLTDILSSYLDSQ